MTLTPQSRIEPNTNVYVEYEGDTYKIPQNKFK